jgi:hypothetical protein
MGKRALCIASMQMAMVADFGDMPAKTMAGR